MNFDEFITTVSSICELYGVQVTFFDNEQRDKYAALSKYIESPFDSDISIITAPAPDDDDKFVAEILVKTNSYFYEHDRLYYGVKACGVIHELGHICTVGSIDDDVNETDFLAWEFAIVKEFGLEKYWKKSMIDYGITLNDPIFEGRFNLEYKKMVSWAWPFQDIEKSDQEFIIEKLSQKAEKLRYIINGKPVRVCQYFDREIVGNCIV